MPSPRIPEPLGKRVVVQREKTPEKIGAIFLPEESQKPMAMGKVVDAHNDSALDIGDIVCFKKWAGVIVEVDKIEYLILGEDEVDCRIRGEEVE